jgi:hypothetical protein
VSPRWSVPSSSLTFRVAPQSSEERQLWVARKGSLVAEARMLRDAEGTELRVSVAGRVVFRRRCCTDCDVRELGYLAQRARDMFVAHQWSVEILV